MTDFQDRERAEERKYAMDEETTFRIAARSNKLLGLWAAAKMGLTPEETEAYAKSVVQADFEESGHEDVIRKVLGDLVGAGIDIDEAGVRTALEEKTVEARRQLMGEV
ncbi:MAG: aldolase [Sphingomonadales bacterium 63-6]|nr:MAG: aldolase [Sphingomonadales bacterium 63-6]